VRYQHDWGPHPRFESHHWRCCRYCGAGRVYDYMPGWPGWYVYFKPDGSYSGKEGSVEPECPGPPPLVGLR
jgi:hypothetical protein